MPSKKSIYDFDPTVYMSLPRLNVSGLLTVVKVLIQLQPEGDWPEVETAVERVVEDVSAIDTVLVDRIVDPARFSRDDVKFDLFVDGLWGLFRDRLTGWSRYLADGRKRLALDAQLEIDLDALEHRAERASEVLDKLFVDGLEFLRRNYNEQAQLMSNVLEAIAVEKLDDELSELTGAELLPLLRACQRHYDKMVSDRLAREQNTTIGNLNLLKARLLRSVQFYVSAVIGTLNAKKPNTVEAVEAALQPIVNVRLGRNPTANTAIESKGAEGADQANAIESDEA